MIATLPRQLAAALLLPALAAAASAPRWETYANARFVYTLCYPADRLTPRPESENGDGRAFTGARGGELKVWGQHNALERTLGQARAADEARLADEGSAITYRAAGRGWYVLSGRVGSTVFYLRSILSNDRFVTFELRYPAWQSGAWNPIAAHISRCLKG